MKSLDTVPHQTPKPHVTASWATPTLIGAKLRIGRVLKKMTFDDVARATGVFAGTLDLIEHGRADVSASLVVRLCDLYGIDLVETLRGVRS